MTAATDPNNLGHPKNAAHTASMGGVSRTAQRVLAASTAIVATLVGCGDDEPEPQDTTVLFDGETYTIHAPVECVMTNGNLGINATAERGKTLISVYMTPNPPLVVRQVGFRHFDVRGFTNNSDEVTATKVDDTYTISGRMPPGEGERERHQFKFEVTCLEVSEYVPGPAPNTRIPRPPRPRY